METKRVERQSEQERKKTKRFRLLKRQGKEEEDDADVE